MDEELKSILEDENTSSEEKQASIKKLIGEKFVSNEKYSKKQEEIATKQKEIETIQSDFNAFKQSKMTEEEKKEEEAKLEREKTQNLSNKLSEYIAKNAFAEAGLKEEDYKDLLPNIIQATPEATKAMAENIGSLISKTKNSMQEELKSSLSKQEPTPAAGNAKEQVPATDMEKLQAAYAEATNAIEQSKILQQINELRDKPQI